MKVLIKLIFIGVLSGAVLAGLMKLIFVITGDQAYNLLYNVDYIPIIHIYDNTPYFGLLFHYVFCIVSVIGLYCLLSFFNLHHKMTPYVVIYTMGSGVLYFLTSLTNQPPSEYDFLSWFYWTGSHVLFSFVTAFSIKKWL